MKRIILLLCICITFFSCKNEKRIEKNIKLNGPVFGTGYNIQYHSEEGINYQPQFDSLFAVINKSLSTYIPDSDISKWNRNEEVNVDKHFRKVFNTSKKIASFAFWKASPLFKSDLDECFPTVVLSLTEIYIV